MIIREINLETGLEVEREMSSTELKKFQAEEEAILTRKAEAEAKEAARQSALEKLAALGLTEAEIQALAGQCEH